MESAEGFGVVTEAQSKRMMGRAGKLNLSISYVRLSDQEKIPLTASKNSKGKGSGVGMGVGIAASAVLFFPAAPFFLLMHGKDVTIPQGTEITAFVAGDARVNLANFGGTPAAPAYAPAPGYAPAPAPAPAPAYAPVAEPPAPPAAAQVAIAIESTPPGADIEIDGGFVGNTPSTITVAAGSHQIAVKKKGFADWTRTLNVTSGDIHLNAQLEAAAAQ